MTDSRSATQKVLDEQLKERVLKSANALVKSLEEEEDWNNARRPVLENGILLLELDQVNHAGIRDLKKGVGHVTGELGTLTKLIRENNGKDVLIEKGPLKGIPRKYVFAGGIIAMGCITIVVLYALAHGKMNELVEGFNKIRGRPTAALEVPAAEGIGAVARRDE